MSKKLSHTQFYKNIQKAIEQARRKVAATINVAMVEAYWHIGKMIVEEEQAGKERAAYGDKLLSRLAEQLSTNFGKGFNRTNLAYMRQFYLTFKNFHALRGELSWTHYRRTVKFWSAPGCRPIFQPQNVKPRNKKCKSERILRFISSKIRLPPCSKVQVLRLVWHTTR